MANVSHGTEAFRYNICYTPILFFIFCFSKFHLPGVTLFLENIFSHFIVSLKLPCFCHELLYHRVF